MRTNITTIPTATVHASTRQQWRVFAFAASANPPLFRASLWHRWGQALPAAYGGWESNLLRSLTKSFRPAIHICMEAFRQWLIQEERQALDPVVVQSYDRAFQAELEKLIQRARSNGTLRQSLESMRQCPVRTANGCTGWTDYIIGALLRNCPRTVDLDQAVSYIVFRMLGTRGERGEPRKTLFDMDPARPYDTEIGSPLTARFRTF